MRIIYSLLLAISLGLLAGYVLFFWLTSTLPFIPDDLRHLVYAQPTQIFADDGSLVYKLGGQSYVSLDKISPYFQQAVIAAEDADFWSHHGVDKLALLRAFYNTMFRGRVQGGSTITQQLAKNLFLSFEKRFLRKARELLIALQLETMFSKEEILEAYCNLIYFGGTAYGVEDAAQQFFGKSAKDLNLPESALLAGIINSPQALNPFSHPEAASRRQAVVLRRMHHLGMISDSLCTLALADTLHFQGRPDRGNDFIDYVIQLAEVRYGEEALYYGGLKIYTTLDADLQRIAEEELALGLARLEAELDSTGQPLQGAIAVVSVPTGEVKALVGARRRIPGGFNRAVATNRHVGSGIKPFVYYAAFDHLGMTPLSLVNDTLTAFRTQQGRVWAPRNFDRRFRGPMIIKYAFIHSINVIAAQLGYRLGPQVLVQTLRQFGISSEIPPVMSMSIGTVGISPLEMAAAYAVFARNGVYFRPVFIKRVEDLNGFVIERAYLIGEERLDARKSYMVLDMMRDVVERGTGRSIRAAGFLAPAAGKTGTSTEFTDAWFTGVTTSLAASVWVGYDRQFQLYTRNGVGVTGGYGAAPIWASFMKRATDRYPARAFNMPPGLKTMIVDPFTGWPVAEPPDGLTVVVPEELYPALPTHRPLRRFFGADSL